MSKIAIVKEAAEKAMAAENERAHHLSGKAEKLVAGIIVVTGFQLLDTPTLLESSSPWVKILCCLALAVLSLSLLFGLSGMRLKNYEGYPRGDKLWENLKSEEVSEDAAGQAILQSLLKAREQNARVNDAKVNSLFWCGWLFFAGFLSVAGSQLLSAFANL